MSRVLQVALREFQSTVLTKGFIIGVLITPVIIGVMILIFPILLDQTPPRIQGEVALADPTGEVADELASWLAPEAMAGRREDLLEKAQSVVPVGVPTSGDAPRAALESVLGEVPTLTVVSLAPGSDLEAAKEPLFAGGPRDGGRVALVVVHPDAIRAPEGTQFGSYDLFVRKNLDDRIIDEIRGGVREALINARVREYGLDGELVRSLSRVPRVRPTTVTRDGEKVTHEIFTMMLPLGFMILLLTSVLTGGQYLMTTTVEEKSSRVVEVLLSAVSPMQLMAGKIIGQMGVGLVLLVLYAGMGVAALVSFALFGLLDPWLIVYLAIFYLIGYFVVASLMAAVGAAVNEMREAQTLMTPIMVFLMVPWLLWMPISRNPESTLAVVSSFLPPINTFTMLLRMTSSVPPPWWQVWISIAIGVASAWAAVWFAAKVFRIGLLMFGKPPNLATLIRWVRMA